MSSASANAFINARLVTLRSDVAGEIEMPARALGARVGKGEVVASVTDSLADSVRLNDLLLEQDFLASEIIRLSSDADATRQILSGLEERAATYSQHRVAELEIRLQHARARLALIEGRGDVGDENAAVDAVGADTEELPGADRFPALALDHARERVEVLEVAVNAAKAGVFLGDGYNDAPNAEQRAVELRSEIAAIQSSLADAQARQAALTKRIGRERERVNGLSGGDLAAPVNGLVWEVLAADGEHLERGDPVLKLVDCGSVMVSLSVSEGVYNSLSPGQSAEFRPQGGSQVFDATVLRLAGAGAATVYRNLAVAPSSKHLERYDVTLLVSGLKDDPELACAVGRTGRVFFERRPLDWLRRLF
ncbi:HlyD family efflux transporter periplasmic adaptor subunit [Sulfitobacter pseudonitzschiae]|nr:HlyD family secretion protein [Pseudosulfitobacter pseudonitzschiae]MBM1816117.1 HlyD family efflux transporter periplasmic adaptor subunit [Pseudosulfitobacter pseudonitzschiae]MBM1833423.1 HlyD family efflux transporter periplasmic adaptor subunit [Pseudosulfitobacter pseudonitzschiae]MBM1838290.1 HlyD family efflux transporter periplasmic adaptor subunit [Pseudosulfitobacter pseudonitzschiae]MBM1842822.1 HlyD family efflux transporter periplasmic adaptor subunit [Pseudosulfitobacter pseud